MTGTRVANVRNGLLAAGAPGTKQHRANRRWSTSVTPLDRSDLSRVTLVEEDPELTADDSSESNDSYEIISYDLPKYTWVDHVRGVFCMSPSKKRTIMRKESSRAKPPVGPVNDLGLSTWPSPWILPVYVYPNRGDASSETVPKVGKCTIDTGNLQGNIVSREFVERVLEYPPERFRELTKEEERGGTGITGDLHVPEGAIYLTWYHKNSTRVFRDMRFLISPHRDCDLIIGARSIQKDGILNVPCLMTDNRAHKNVTIINRGTKGLTLYEKFHTDKETQEDWLQKKRNAIFDLSRKDIRNALPDLIPEYASLMVDYEFYTQANDLYNALKAEMSNEDKIIHASPYLDRIRVLRNRNGLDPESPYISEESGKILKRLRTKAPNSPEGFEEVWHDLALVYPLSSELQGRLNNTGDHLYDFWEQLQSEYRLYEQPR